jgi:hypothetical protein
MKMRAEHMQAFSEAAVDEFEDRVVAHLSQYFGDRCAELGQVKVRELIRDAATRANDREFTAEQDVARYVQIAFVYGTDFDMAAWAAPLLARTDLSPREKLQRLYGQALLQMEKAARGSP